MKGYVLADSDSEGIQQKELVLKESGYDEKNTFVINDITDTKKESTLEDLFNKKYLIEIISEHYGIEIDLDSKKPLVAQVKKLLQDNQKMYRETDKEVLKHLYFTKISKLSNTELKKEEYFKFAEALCLKIKS